MLGRIIGLAVIVPGVYFASRGYMTSTMKLRTFLISLMVGSQGVLGWFMVKSGLGEDVLKSKTPRVNHYWLAAHLGSAFLIYSAMVLTGLEVLEQNMKLRKSTGISALVPFFSPQVSQHLKNTPLIRRMGGFVTILVFFTAISGALVAGLDAGLIYNEFPRMGEGLIPSDMVLLTLMI
jgi:cytochrome c oxidase assembly protein subunit 15